MLFRSLAATLAFGTAGSAFADSFASSILIIQNFRLINFSTGLPFSTADFDTLTGTNDAHATAILNGIPHIPLGADSKPILVMPPPDLPVQCAGPVGACASIPANFAPVPTPVVAAPGTFGYADQDLDGASITILPPFGSQAAGATARTRADAALQVDGIASGNSDVGTSTTFSFTLSNDAQMTIDFTGIPYTQAWVSPGAGPTTNANARLSWSINIVDDTGTTVHSFAPSELNELALVSRTDGAPGVTTYNPGANLFSSTTPLLDAGRVYQLTIQHNTLANVLQLQEVPEPAALAIFAIGLLGMGALRRRQA